MPRRSIPGLENTLDEGAWMNFTPAKKEYAVLIKDVDVAFSVKSLHKNLHLDEVSLNENGKKILIRKLKGKLFFEIYFRRLLN